MNVICVTYNARRGEQNAGNSLFSALSSIGRDKWRPVHIVINYVVTFITGG